MGRGGGGEGKGTEMRVDITPLKPGKARGWKVYVRIVLKQDFVETPEGGGCVTKCQIKLHYLFNIRPNDFK